MEHGQSAAESCCSYRNFDVGFSSFSLEVKKTLFLHISTHDSQRNYTMFCLFLSTSF
jgi:hypothetical protein